MDHAGEHNVLNKSGAENQTPDDYAYILNLKQLNSKKKRIKVIRG
jgi:hypothetical protein